jgi:hypothetical protein
VVPASDVWGGDMWLAARKEREPRPRVVLQGISSALPQCPKARISSSRADWPGRGSQLVSTNQTCSTERCSGRIG